MSGTDQLLILGIILVVIFLILVIIVLIKQSKTNNDLYGKLEKADKGILQKINSHNDYVVNSKQAHDKYLTEIKNQMLDLDKLLKSKISDLQQNLSQSVEKIYLSNNDFVNKNAQQLKQRLDELGNNFIKSISEVQQKLDNIKKDQTNNWSQQLEYLQSFEKYVSESKIINNKIQNTVLDIEKQEQILNGMIQQHIAIAEYSKEIVESQESIVKLLEVLMLDTLATKIDNLKK